MERPKFVFPDEPGEDFQVLRKRLYDFKETIVVDDYVEIKNMIRELESIDPYKIQTELVPRLEALIKESNGRLKGLYIWP